MNQKALEAMLKPLLSMLESAFPDAEPTCKLCKMLNDEIESILGDNNLTPLIKKAIVSGCENDPEAMLNKIVILKERLEQIILTSMSPPTPI